MMFSAFTYVYTGYYGLSEYHRLFSVPKVSATIFNRFDTTQADNETDSEDVPVPASEAFRRLRPIGMPRPIDHDDQKNMRLNKSDAGDPFFLMFVQWDIIAQKGCMMLSRDVTDVELSG